MSLFIASLNSGSNGNCYYVGNSNEAVLVDAGISCRETEKRMKSIGLAIEKVKAVFISHEHSDHIRGVEVLSRKYKLPVYITNATLKNSGLKLERSLLRKFKAGEKVRIGALNVVPFLKSHDASDPHSFIVNSGALNIGVLTDIGKACKNVIRNFSRCQAVFLEANYDEQMLETGRYPVFLKRRISSDEGHLSNAQALELFVKYRSPLLSHILLSHLSKENNDPELALKFFKPHAGETLITVASRYEASPVYHIRGNGMQITTPIPVQQAEQMSLF